MSPSHLRRFFALTAVIAATACGSGMLDAGRLIAPSASGGATVGSPANYLGAFGDSLHHGTVSITVSPSLTVTGTLTIVGAPSQPLTGTVDTAAAEMHVTGGGYTISGFTNNGTLSGFYTGPGGNGFVVASSDSLTQQTHKQYCGVYTSTNSNGRIALQVLSSGDVGGFVVQTSGSALSSFLTGTVINNQTFTGVTNNGIALSGTVSSDLSTIVGTYVPPVGSAAVSSSATGQFSATTGGC